MSTHESAQATDRRWATESETAEHARVSNNTIRRWRDRGLITGYRVGRTVRYDLCEIDELLISGAGVAP
jgi:excisionase family DNA binding protein